MRTILIKIFAVLLLLQPLAASTQQAPFWNEILEYKRADSIQRPPANAILFVGSSSFRLWKDVETDFAQHKIINRGFGGSSIPDVIRYAEDIIFAYHPKQIVIYCGENDIASSDTVTGEIVSYRFQQLFQLIRKRLPKVHIAFVSIKPSPSRWHLKEKMEKANTLIKNFLKKQKKAVFVDIWEDMLNKEGNPAEELFVKDRLHMNEKGYAIWQKKIKPVLKK